MNIVVKNEHDWNDLNNQVTELVEEPVPINKTSKPIPLSVQVCNPIVPSPEQVSIPSAAGDKKKVVNNLNIVIKNERDWNDLNHQVTELVVDEDVCNDMKGDLVIENLNYLKSILVRKNSMKNLNSLKIRNCELLEKIKTEGYHDGKGSFNNVKIVEISRLIDLIQFI